MKKCFLIGAILSLCCMIPPSGGKAVAAQEVTPRCKSSYLCDAESGAVVFEQNAEERYPIASMCKIMTLILSFEALENQTIAPGEEIAVSYRAAHMGGSQVFLGEGLSYPAEELIKSVVVCSANDSCVALAERIEGSEAAFVDRMNERAKELGATNTLFSNCTGLPKDPQYSCAKDVSAMFRELISHEQYFEYSHIWLEDFLHPDGRTTMMTNTNKLVRFYDGCDGGKTGYTVNAGFCLAATAHRGDMRLVSVVIGADNSQNRFEDTKSMMNYAFSAYERIPILKKGEKLEECVQIRGGKQKSAAVVPESDLGLFFKKGENKLYELRIDLDELTAPVSVGERVGEAIVFVDGIEIGRTALLSADQVLKANYGDRFKDAAQNWT